MRLRASLLALCATLAGLLAAAVAAPSLASPGSPGEAAADLQPPTVRYEACSAQAAGPSLGAWPVEATGSCEFAVPAGAEWAVVRVQRRSPDPTVLALHMRVEVCGPEGPCQVRFYEGEDVYPLELPLPAHDLAGRDRVTVTFGYEGLGLRGLTGEGESFDVRYEVASR